GRVPGRAQRERRTPSRRATAVSRLVGDDPEQPWLERRTRPEAPEGAVRLHERVLRRLLRVGRVAGDQVGGAQRDPLVSVHELLVGVGVAPLRAGDELSVVEWPAHHCGIYTAA